MVGVDVERRVERRDVLVERQDATDVGDRPVEQRRHPLDRRFAAVGGLQVAHGAQHKIDFLDHMHRQTDGPRVVHDAAFDALADPPGRVGRKTEAALGVELFQRMDETEVAFLDQVEKGNAAVQVVLGDIHHQAQVVLDHLLTGHEIATTHQTSFRQFLVRRQQRPGADFVEVDLGDILDQAAFDRWQIAQRQQKAITFRGAAQRRFVFVILVVTHLFGRKGVGSTGLPCLRISKCSLTLSVPVSPISAIFWPRLTACPSLTRIRRLWA
ncbi:hypothetical protein SDC9_150908 [bioreactor metagenome]|uniref:Uncharacterized protein n=1 Tax=bioreactor metagenome TaxID=1076179 RepID=A0A645EQF3_9ZZZZ